MWRKSNVAALLFLAYKKTIRINIIKKHNIAYIEREKKNLSFSIEENIIIIIIKYEKKEKIIKRSKRKKKRALKINIYKLIYCCYC